MTSYNELFALMDINKNGSLSKEEVFAFCECLPNAPKNSVITRLFDQADADKSGEIDTVEFSALCEGIKLLVGMSEEEIIDTYCQSEFDRLFRYHCSTGEGMRKDEARKLVEMLNESLGTRLGGEQIISAFRDATSQHQTVGGGGKSSSASGDIISQRQFRAVIEVLYISHHRPLSIIITSLKEEELRRKDHLQQTRKLFERRMSQKGGEANIPSRKGQDASASKNQRCAECEKHFKEMEEVCQKRLELESQIEKLTSELKSANETCAENVVSHQKEVGRLKETLSDVEQDAFTLHAELEQAQAERKQLQSKVTDQENTSFELLQCQEKLGISQREATQSKEELDACRREIQILEERLKRKTEEVSIADQKCVEMNAKIDAKENELRRMDEVYQLETTTKTSEAAKANHIAEELKRRQEELQTDMKERERILLEDTANLRKREGEIEKREDEVRLQQTFLRQLESEFRAQWENVFEECRKSQDAKAVELEDRELELIHIEAELKVKEERIHRSMDLAERISFPERQRRLYLLKNIEKDLCERERALRQKDGHYLAQLTRCEVASLRDENEVLKRQVSRLTNTITNMEALIGGSSNSNAMMGAKNSSTFFSSAGKRPLHEQRRHLHTSSNTPYNNNLAATVPGMGHSSSHRAMHDQDAFSPGPPPGSPPRTPPPPPLPPMMPEGDPSYKNGSGSSGRRQHASTVFQHQNSGGVSPPAQSVSSQMKSFTQQQRQKRGASSSPLLYDL